MKPLGALLALALLLPAIPAAATTYLVLPDGTGEFPEIQSALRSAVDGDVIELADGAFSGKGNHDVDFLGKAVTLRSRSGNQDLCIVDLTGGGGFLFATGEGPASLLEGITIVNGYRHEGGGAIACLAASPTIRHCTLAGNEGYNGGGGVLCFGGASPSIEGCLFKDNLSTLGGGVCCLQASAPTIGGCEFDGNSATQGGAIAAYEASAPAIADSRFQGQSAWTEGAALYAATGARLALVRCVLWGNIAQTTGTISLDGATLELTSCTGVANSSEAFLRLGAGAAATLDHSIVAFHGGGVSVLCQGGTAALVCCDLFANGGDWIDCIADQAGQNGNLDVDPSFCNAAVSDFTLHEDSPCGPINETCGLIGALGVACGPTPVEETSWGAIKNRFRR